MDQMSDTDPIADRLAELCRRLDEADSPLVTDSQTRSLVERIAASVRARADDGCLSALFDELDEVLRQSGVSVGLRSYQSVSGMDDYHNPAVLICPGDRRCARRQAPSESPANDPMCGFHKQQLLRHRISS